MDNSIGAQDLFQTSRHGHLRLLAGHRRSTPADRPPIHQPASRSRRGQPSRPRSTRFGGLPAPGDSRGLSGRVGSRQSGDSGPGRRAGDPSGRGDHRPNGRMVPRRRHQRGRRLPAECFGLPTARDIPASGRRRRPAGTRTLDSGDIEWVEGLRVTTPLRTALDLGRLLKRDDALAALDGLLRLRRFTQDDLRAEVRRFRGYRGVVQLRCLIPISDARSESPRESVLRLRWLDARLPTPHPQYVIHDDNGFPIYRLDLADPIARYAAEYDGQEHHFTAEQRASDDRRRAWLRRRGWQIDVFDGDALASRTIGNRLWDGHRRAALRFQAVA